MNYYILNITYGKRHFGAYGLWWV